MNWGGGVCPLTIGRGNIDFPFLPPHAKAAERVAKRTDLP